MHGLRQRSETTVREIPSVQLTPFLEWMADRLFGVRLPTPQKFNAQRSAMNSLRTERRMLNAQPKSVTYLTWRESVTVGLLPNRPTLGMTAAAGRLSS